jgi:hypothetical protein
MLQFRRTWVASPRPFWFLLLSSAQPGPQLLLSWPRVFAVLY